MAASQAARRALFSLEDEPGLGMGCLKMRPLEQVHEQAVLDVSGVGSVHVIEGLTPGQSKGVSNVCSSSPFFELEGTGKRTHHSDRLQSRSQDQQ